MKYCFKASSLVSRRLFFALHFMIFYTLKALCRGNSTIQRVIEGARDHGGSVFYVSYQIACAQWT